MGGPNETRAKFPAMDQGTQDDWQIISGHFLPFASKVADRVLDHLKLLDGDYGGFPIDRLQHSLQTATRAYRDGRSDDYVVMALLHDIGDTLGTFNHPDIAAAIIKPFVSNELHWICEKHGLGYTSSCVCCRDDYEKHREKKNRDARFDRDNALRQAREKSKAALDAVRSGK